MKYFAELGVGNVVLSVHNVSDTDAPTEEQGVQFIQQLLNTNSPFVETCKKTRGGVHIDGGTPLRKNYAYVGGTYDMGRDAFINIKPYDSWVLDEDTCLWGAPTAYPDDGNDYIWNESTTSWQLVE